MRTWVKLTLAGVAVIAVCFVVLAGTGAYFIYRHFERREVPETVSVKEIDSIKMRFGSRPALVEIVDPRTADIRINRPDETTSSPVDTVHIVNWKSETGELITTDAPLWLLRFSSVNILSQLGVAPERFRLTVDDIERYGPGIIVDYSSPGAFRLLVWVD